MDSSLECAVWILSIATVCILGVVYSYSTSMHTTRVALQSTTHTYIIFIATTLVVVCIICILCTTTTLYTVLL